MSYDPRIESIKAYKRMIEYFKKQIAKLEREIFSEFCCQPKERIYLPIANKRRIKNETNKRKIKTNYSRRT